MKKVFLSFLCLFLITACSISTTTTDNSQFSETSDSNTSTNVVTKEMAYEGIYNYCHSVYDWSIAKDNPDIMYLKMGEETETEYQVIFRSYTGSFVYYYVDKSNGITRLVEYVPSLDTKTELGIIKLYDYLE